MSKLKIAMICPPWLTVPPVGYGGIEAQTDGLIRGLVAQGHEVAVFTVGESKSAATEQHHYYQKPQYHRISQAFNLVAPLVVSHLQHALNQIRKIGGYSLIHDNSGILAHLAAYANMSSAAYPPVLFTLHGPVDDQSDLNGHEAIGLTGDSGGSLYFNGISRDQIERINRLAEQKVIGVVHNGIDADHYPFQGQKGEYFLSLARVTPDKGQHLAIKYCRQQGSSLRIAGTVCGLGSNPEIEQLLEGKLPEHAANLDYLYFRDQIWPQIDHSQIVYSGNVSGIIKLDLIANAKALLFPIQWSEPFGMAVIEALACGTPVVAMNVGAMPEIIEHGINGFLANSEQEFQQFMQLVDEIDPVACRESVRRKFSHDVMAEQYVSFYRRLLSNEAAMAVASLSVA